MLQESLPRAELTNLLRATGIEIGDSLIVHSSYRKIGPVEGGPEGVIDAILDAIGPSGNLMLPAFNYTTPLPKPWYDPNKTPCRTGIIPELGRQRPDAVRSLQPTHSVAVIGPDAVRLTQNHLEVRTFGRGSPIDKLATMGGKILLLGVGHTSNSTIHVGEEYAGIPKCSFYDELPRIKVRLPDGALREYRLDTSPSCSAGFGAVEATLRRNGLIRDMRSRASLSQVMQGHDVIRSVRELLQENPVLFYCTRAECKPCSGAQRLLHER